MGGHTVYKLKKSRFSKFELEFVKVWPLRVSNMSKAHPPELKKYMDKKIHLKINGGRAVEGVLRGFDPFMNLVIDDAIEFTKAGDKNYIGMVVLRGNSVVMLEAKDRLDR